MFLLGKSFTRRVIRAYCCALINKRGGEEEEEIVLPLSFPRGCHKKGGGGEDPKCFFPFFSRLKMVLLFSRFLFPSYLVIETFGLANKRKSKERLFISLHVLEKVRFVAPLPLHEKWVVVTSFVSFALKASCCMLKPCLLKDFSPLFLRFRLRLLISS